MNATLLPSGRAGPQDRTSRVLIWILLTTTAMCWIGMLFATRTTYRQAAPLPKQMIAADGGDHVGGFRRSAVAGSVIHAARRSPGLDSMDAKYRRSTLRLPSRAGAVTCPHFPAQRRNA